MMCTFMNVRGRKPPQPEGWEERLIGYEVWYRYAEQDPALWYYAIFVITVHDSTDSLQRRVRDLKSEGQWSEFKVYPLYASTRERS